ncbi:hypothetical protein PPERSA_03434 [Pseudocohnilembus persalinus]|uniref:Uncharacterized protein n=1 Tax=Pseudocohnilembus persalinus TaxID=266149 RepID=A0A0V0QBU5_PSEPJ|nr:hypothetical protein PPERSA_03434 [Pseudocohnilembus persalinus]|eukprot:KRW99633.1 hypothetical protein PPERSA_03434 [Pseudocohnilembus persalinus]
MQKTVQKNNIQEITSGEYGCNNSDQKQKQNMGMLIKESVIFKKLANKVDKNEIFQQKKQKFIQHKQHFYTKGYFNLQPEILEELEGKQKYDFINKAKQFQSFFFREKSKDKQLIVEIYKSKIEYEYEKQICCLELNKINQITDFISIPLKYLDESNVVYQNYGVINLQEYISLKEKYRDDWDFDSIITDEVQIYGQTQNPIYQLSEFNSTVTNDECKLLKDQEDLISSQIHSAVMQKNSNFISPRDQNTISLHRKSQSQINNLNKQSGILKNLREKNDKKKYLDQQEREIRKQIQKFKQQITENKITPQKKQEIFRNHLYAISRIIQLIDEKILNDGDNKKFVYNHLQKTGKGVHILRGDGEFLSEKYTKISNGQLSTNVQFKSGDSLIMIVDTTLNTIKFQNITTSTSYQDNLYFSGQDYSLGFILSSREDQVDLVKIEQYQAPQILELEKQQLLTNKANQIYQILQASLDIQQFLLPLFENTYQKLIEQYTINQFTPIQNVLYQIPNFNNILSKFEEQIRDQLLYNIYAQLEQVKKMTFVKIVKFNLQNAHPQLEQQILDKGYEK